MTVISNSLQFTIPETAYLAFHVGWRLPELNVMVAIGVQESQLFSGTYRPESLNPAGGRDMGLLQINDKWQARADPFVRFDPLIHLQDARAIWVRSGFAPWSYPSQARNDATMNVAGVAAQIGSDPYNITRSPYWRMVEAGMNVADLPKPPEGLYVSRLPAPPLKYGDSPLKGPTFGPRINQLQRLGQEYGEYPPGGTDQYFGPKTRAWVASLQNHLLVAATGNYDQVTFDAWDHALSFDFWRRGR